jgi:hypothetical protein
MPDARLPMPDAVARAGRARLDDPVIPTLLEQFWPSRRDAQFDERCRPAA